MQAGDGRRVDMYDLPRSAFLAASGRANGVFPQEVSDVPRRGFWGEASCGAAELRGVPHAAIDDDGRGAYAGERPSHFARAAAGRGTGGRGFEWRDARNEVGAIPAGEGRGVVAGSGAGVDVAGSGGVEVCVRAVGEIFAGGAGAKSRGSGLAGGGRI